jgi:hypothetical protein
MSEREKNQPDYYEIGMHANQELIASILFRSRKGHLIVYDLSTVRHLMKPVNVWFEYTPPMLRIEFSFRLVWMPETAPWTSTVSPIWFAASESLRTSKSSANVD